MTDWLLSNLPLLIAIAVMALIAAGRYRRRRYNDNPPAEEHAPRRAHGRVEDEETRE